MYIIYRISDSGYAKSKPSYINNKNCLKNALEVFPEDRNKWLIIADNCSEQTIKMIRFLYNGEIKHVSVGHGAGTFNIALDHALTLPKNEIVYFIENDYIHRNNSSLIIKDAIENLGANFVTLYLHPDKFISPELGGNPNVDSDGGYLTKIYKGDKCLFGLFDSTTMTFACKVQQIEYYEDIFRKYTNQSYPRDYEMFNELRSLGVSLLCPLESYSTHGETKWEAPFINWEDMI